MLTRALAATALLGLLAVPPAGASDVLRPLRTATPPVIDGDLSDPVWQAAPTVTGFTTWMPDYGKLMVDQTVVYYAHDAENLYFAFRAFDSDPGRIKASIAARDGIGADDWICINLDSFGDQQSLYGLYVNPLGIQGDSRFAAGREDFGFDAVWYSAGRIDDEGYTIEVRIPFKSLRYGNANPVRMALIFERRVSRRSEQGTYPPLDPKVGPNFLTQNVPIEFADIRHYRLVEILPDAVYDYQMERVSESLERVSSGPEFGLTAKYGVTAQLVFDGAVNPDFSQVEADAGQIDVNRRYALFFPEKRPFFLEGRDSFNFAGADYSPMQSVVHTRTIVNPIAGAKLTGKLGFRRHARHHLRRRRTAGLGGGRGKPGLRAGGSRALQAIACRRLVSRRVLHRAGGRRGVQPGVRRRRLCSGDTGGRPRVLRLRVVDAAARRRCEGWSLRPRQLLARQPEDEPLSPGSRHLPGVRHLDGVCLPYRCLPGIDRLRAAFLPEERRRTPRGASRHRRLRQGRAERPLGAVVRRQPEPRATALRQNHREVSLRPTRSTRRSPSTRRASRRRRARN